MPTRRSFLGTLLGAVAGAPFFAMALDQPWQRVMQPYRLAILSNDLIIQAPAVDLIVQASNMIVFTAEALHTQTPVVCVGAALYTPDGRLVTKRPFTHPCTLLPGDALRVNATLDIAGSVQVLTREEIVEAFIKRSQVAVASSNPRVTRRGLPPPG